MLTQQHEFKCRRQELQAALKHMLFQRPAALAGLLGFLDVAEARHGANDATTAGVIGDLRKVVQRVAATKKMVSQFHVVMFVEGLGIDALENSDFVEELLTFLTNLAANQVS